MAAWGNTFDILLQAPKEFTVEGEYAVVDICGPLSQKPDFLVRTDDYDSICCRVTAALESECKAVVLRINSPGGDFAGSLETSKHLRALAAKAGKKLIAFTDTRALSAGYALAIAASEIIITPSAFVGSVGVWAPLVDETEADRAKGLNIRIVPSGTKKAARNPHVGMTDETVADLQIEVDAMAAMFFGAVSDARKITVKQVESLQGGEVFGEGAVKAQLADRVVLNWGAFLQGETVTAKAKATAKGDSMPKPYMKALQAAAEEGDEDAKKALSAMAKADPGDGDGDEDEKKMKAKKKAEKEEDDKKQAKAEEEENFKKKAAEEDKKKDDMAKAQASGNDLLLSLTKELHAMKAAASQAAEATARAALIASRPDFSDAVRATLAQVPLAQVKEACETWPRVQHGTPVAALSATGTSGKKSEDDGLALDVEQERALARAFGTDIKHRGVSNEGHSMTLGYMTPAEAQARLDKMGGK